MLADLRNLLFGDRVLLRWSAFSVGSFLTVVSLTALLRESVGLNEKAAFAIPLVLVFFANFVTMRYLVYDGPRRPIARQFAHYSVSATIFRGLEYVAYWLSLDLLGVNYLIAVLVIMPTAFLLKFLFYKVAIFGSDSLSWLSR